MATVLSPIRTSVVWAPLLAVAAVAWLAVAQVGHAAPGLMGMSPAAYAGGWLVMTAAMMLPPIAWFASVYVAAVARQTQGAALYPRIVLLVLGYLLVWAATAVLALGFADVIDRAAIGVPGALPWAGGAILVAAGIYQLTPLKRRCLARCRSPLSFALAASRHTGRLRDVNVGLTHGAWCVACCWALMVVLVVVGTMSLAWMAAIAAAVLLERSWRYGERLSRAVGVGLVAAGLMVPFVTFVAPALHVHGGGMPMEPM